MGERCYGGCVVRSGAIMLVTVLPSGAVEVSQLCSGYLVTRTYYGYSRGRAVASFMAEFKTSVKPKQPTEDNNDNQK